MRNKVKIIVILILVLFLYSNLFAGMAELKHDGEHVCLDNNKYFNKINAKLFCGISDVALLKVNNDPAEINSDEFKKIPTFFAIDRCWNRIIWATMDLQTVNIVGDVKWPFDDQIIFNTKEDGFNSPMGMASNGSDRLIVADTYNDRLVEYLANASTSGITLQQTRVIGQGVLSRPWGVCYDQYNNIYVVDSKNSKIRKFNSSGVLVKSVGEGRGNDKYKYGHLSDIAVCKNSGDIYVCDSFNDRIIRYNTNFEYVSETTDNLKRPYNKIDVDKSGTVFAAALDNENIPSSHLVINSDLTQIVDIMQFGNVKAVGICGKTGKCAIAEDQRVCHFFCVNSHS